MMYQCPKGHQSTDSDYCSECGALIGQSKISDTQLIQSMDQNKSSQPQPGGEICPDCGTAREGNARFCEVCRHDFQENKTGVAEVIVASQQAEKSKDVGSNSCNDAVKNPSESTGKPSDNLENSAAPDFKKSVDNAAGNADAGILTEGLLQKLNVVISVDSDKASAWDGESPIKPDTVDRVFPLDLDENLVGRRSNSKGIYPEIEINDPGVSHRHLKFIKQPNGSFEVLELGSANGTELNGNPMQPGVNTAIKASDELTLGIWTRLKIVAR